MTIDGTITGLCARVFMLPTTIAPKYAPASDQRGVGRPEQHAAAPANEWRALADKARSWLAREAARVPANGAPRVDLASTWLAATL